MKSKFEPTKTARLMGLELFAGCGALAYGLAEAGFEHDSVFEYNSEAISTLNENKDRGVRHFRDWNIIHADVCDVKFKDLSGRANFVSGGPPCQPFSFAGKHRGADDERNMWPEAIRAVREVEPRGFMFENVRGLLRPNFAQYLEYLRLQLSWPQFGQNEIDWKKKYRLLKKMESMAVKPSYHVSILPINAADFGAPQKRHRVIVMGVRSDLSGPIVSPERSHSRDSLIWDKWVSGEYWKKHGIKSPKKNDLSLGEKNLVAFLEKNGTKPKEKSWVTVRDAIGDLETPTDKGRISNHVLRKGARTYKGHTGSTWDDPAKALKSGSHGVPGGENMVVEANGAPRYFTIREMARLQGLPDSFQIDCLTWKRPVLQLGNAVPVQVAKTLGKAIWEKIL